MSESQSFDVSGGSGALVPRGPTWTPQAPITQSPPPPSSGITAHFVWRSLVRWWKFALPVGLVLGGTAGSLAWLTLKPLYRAEAWLKIEDRRQFIVFPDQTGSQVRTQVELIRSPVVLGKILSNPDVAKMPEIKKEVEQLEWLKARVQVTAGNSELFQIKFEGPDPANARTIVDKIVEVYLKLHESENQAQTDSTIRELERLRMVRERELVRIQEEYRSLAKQAAGMEFVDPNRIVLQSQSAYQIAQDKLASAEYERHLLVAQLTALENDQGKQPEKVPEAVIEKTLLADPELRELAEAMETVKVQMKGYEKAKNPETFPDYRTHKNKLAALQAELDKLLVDRRKQYDEAYAKNFDADRQVSLEKLRRQIADCQVQETLLRERLKVEQESLQKQSSVSLDIDFKRGDLDREQGVHQKIADRVTALKTEKSAPAQVSLLQSASLPTLPTVTPTKKVTLATLGGFAFPFALAILWEFRVRRISHVEQIVNELSLPVVGEITTLPVRSMLPGKRSADRFERHRSTFEESIAYVRTSLLLSDDLREVQVLAVASAISREGKSSLASQLAVSLANSTGETTLLIDSDMRDPDLHEMFGLELEPGLAQVLEREVALDDAIITTWSNRVHILPAGRLMRSPHVLLGGGAFHSLLDEARSRYRYIVIDSPPVLAASEALVVAKAADGTLLCTMRDTSRVSQVRQATERLRAAGARSLGAVFSGVPPHSYSYKYGGYYNNAYSRRTWSTNASATEEPVEPADDGEAT